MSRGENKGFWGEKKGTKADDQNQRLREKKGADSAKGRNKMHDAQAILAQDSSVLPKSPAYFARCDVSALLGF